jgi:hypothetical protein
MAAETAKPSYQSRLESRLEALIDPRKHLMLQVDALRTQHYTSLVSIGDGGDRALIAIQIKLSVEWILAHCNDRQVHSARQTPRKIDEDVDQLPVDDVGKRFVERIASGSNYAI